MKVEDLIHKNLDVFNFYYLELIDLKNIDNSIFGKVNYFIIYKFHYAIWQVILQNIKLDEKFIHKNKNFIDKNCFSFNKNLNEYLIRKYFKYINLFNLNQEVVEKLSINFILDFKEYLDWSKISLNYPFSQTQLSKFKNYIDWKWFSCRSDLTDDIIQKFGGFKENSYSFLHWNHLSYYYPFSDYQLMKFKDYIIWDIISLRKDISIKKREELNLPLIPYDRNNPISKSPLNVLKDFKQH